MPTSPWPPPLAVWRAPGAACRRPRARAALGLPAHRDVGRRGAGVLERVGERLLHDAVGGEVDAGGQRARLALDVQRDRQAGRRARARRARRARERRLRRRALVAVRAARRAAAASRSARRGRCARSGPPPRPPARDRASRIAPRAARLDDHHRHRVGDHVVHLARDPPALVGRRPQRLLLARLLRAGRPPRAAPRSAACACARRGRRARRSARSWSGRRSRRRRILPRATATPIMPTRMTSGAATAARPEVWAPIDQHANSTASSGAWSGSTSVSATLARIHSARASRRR